MSTDANAEVDETANVVDLRGRRLSAVRTSDRAEPTDDADELLVRVGRGDRAAFEELYDVLATRVYGIIRSVVRDPARSDEVTQDVMLEIWRTAPRYDPSMGRARTWALTIAHRRAVDKVRSEQASRERDTRHVQANPEIPQPDVAAAVEQAVGAELDRGRVRAALAELTAAQRDCIELAFFGGHTHNEVAALLGLPLGTVKTRIRDGLIRLRDRLEVEP